MNDRSENPDPLVRKRRHEELLARYEGNGPELSEAEMDELRSFENGSKQ